MLRLALALFAIQAGFHGFTAALPVALDRAGVPDPQIGLIVGTAALVQLPAAFAAGALVDRFGGLRLLLAGGIAYLLGGTLLLVPGVEPGGSPVPFLVARLCQGAGIAATLPAALSLVPRLAPAHRRGFALAFIGSAHNLTLVVLPPISLVILSATSLHGVAAAVMAIVGVGLALSITVPRAFRRQRPTDDGAAVDDLPTTPDSAVAGGSAPEGKAARRLGFAFRPSWARPIAVTLLYVAHWGVVTAYLPQRAEAAGADIGLFFVADGIAILLLRVPSGWLADRMPLRRLVLGGIGVTAMAIALLVLPATTPALVAAGSLTGAGAGLVMTPLLVEMSHRSAEADRGSAFSLFSGALAAALVIGSIGAAPLVGAAGFEAAILASLAGLALAAVIALSDPGLARRNAAVATAT